MGERLTKERLGRIRRALAIEEQTIAPRLGLLILDALDEARAQLHIAGVRADNAERREAELRAQLAEEREARQVALPAEYERGFGAAVADFREQLDEERGRAEQLTSDLTDLRTQLAAERARGERLEKALEKVAVIAHDVGDYGLESVARVALANDLVALAPDAGPKSDVGKDNT